jgi:RNA polymerase sigma-70 factor (ECF subfamily)
MQPQRSHIGDQQNHTQIREHGFAELQDVVSRHLPSFYRRAYRYTGDAHDAEDAVQDALLSACKHLDQFEGKARMTTWLTSIVTNSALTQLRRRPRHPHISLDERLTDGDDYCVSDVLADVRPSPENEFISSESHGRLMHFVTELSPPMRKVIQLHDLEGLTSNEIASLLGVPLATVKTRVSRGRSKLKRVMCGAEQGKACTDGGTGKRC